MFNENDDDEPPALYEDGHWKWDEHNEKLVFISDIKFIPETGYTLLDPSSTLMSTVKFYDDLDIFEQERFKKKFQNKVTEEDVVQLQDIKDLVLYTAPKSLLDSTVIKILHLSSTDRFIRTLILYNQYYLQISDEMTRRILDLETKISTKRSYEIELEYRENLQDLRVLIAKEYCNMISGDGASAETTAADEAETTRATMAAAAFGMHLLTVVDRVPSDPSSHELTGGRITQSRDQIA